MPRDERLLIENFGPIHTADLAIRDLTVFVGPQATGKSLAAQLLYFMRGMEELRAESSITDDESEDEKGSIPESQPELDALNFWLGGQLRKYVSASKRAGTIIKWWAKGKVSDRGNQLSLTITKAQPPTSPRPTISSDYIGDIPETKERQVYIPAGRTLYSFVSPATALPMINKATVSWPGFVTIFYSKLDKIIQEFSSTEGSVPQSKARVTGNDFIDRALATALRCSITYQNNQVRLIIKLGNEQKPTSWRIDPLRAASGQMEAWPFVAVVQDVLNNPNVTRRIFFEEPEAHLHPTAQRGLLDVVAALTNRKQRFVLTTHSPYVIYAINNYLLAQQVLDKGRKLPSPEQEQTALRPDQVAAYRFTTDGQVESLFDEETGLLKTSELDDPAAALSATFSELQDALFEDDK